MKVQDLIDMLQSLDKTLDVDLFIYNQRLDSLDKYTIDNVELNDNEDAVNISN